MKMKLVEWMQRHSSMVSAVAVIISGVATQGCRLYWYQPDEPEELVAFMMEKRHE